ncbi:MAG: ImmA/IrrE family metallo-endopeptidase [Betaproteobacteria bacterium]|nr:ImmA/IrrE family metallo-endopeptidase [Betaproteobacteria bacterium]
MQTLNVKRELIQWAIERSGRSTDVLARAMPKIAQWESGKAHPTLRQLEALAKKTWTPLGYFFLAEPPEERLPVPDFRTGGDHPIPRPSPNLIDTLYTMQRRQAWMREYLIEQKQEPLQYIGSAKVDGNISAVAKRIRQALGIADSWASRISTWTNALTVLREAAEAAGILVVINGVVGNDNHRKLDPTEFRGFVLSDVYAPLVFVNGSDARSAQMFTLAHELAHLWIGEGGLFDLPELQASDNQSEQFCNQIAAEFLIPATELRAFWGDAQRTNEPFQAIAGHFKVSPVVAARRALDLDLIAKPAFFEFYRAYQADERRQAARSKGGGDFYNNQNVRLGKRFARTVMQAAKEGRLLYRDAYALTGLHGSTFDKYAKALGVRA